MAYIQSHKDQAWLLPPSIEELIPEDQICFLVESLVDNIDYQTFDIKYSGVGTRLTLSASFFSRRNRGKKK